MSEIDKIIKEQNCSLMCDTVRQIANERNRFEARVKELEEQLKWYDHYKSSALELKEKYNHLVDINKMVEQKLKVAEEALVKISGFNNIIQKTDTQVFRIYSQEANIAIQTLQNMKEINYDK